MDSKTVQLLLERSLAHINTLNDLERASSQARSTRRARQSNDSNTLTASSSNIATSSSSGSTACSACKEFKTKCIRGLDHHEACARCRATGKECRYPLPKKRGPAGGTRITKLLDGVERDLQALLKQAKSGEDLSPMKQASAQTDEGDGKLDQYVDSETDSASADQAGEEEDVVTESGNPSLLRKPLEFLASLQPDIVDQQNAWPNAQSQPETLSLYALKHESDLSKDPVFQGIITEDELNNLLAFYFSHLRPYFWHFAPEVHTQAFLRLTSPFLTTAIATCAAVFYPLPGDTASKLTEYAHTLANTNFAEGNRSLEVLQGYLCLLHWAPGPTSQALDRSWQYQGQAMRIASEIRLDSLDEGDFCSSYRYLDCFDASVRRGLLECRKRSLVLLYCSEIALATQSGRIESLNGPLLIRGLKWAGAHVDPDPEAYDYFSNLELNCVFVKALHLFNGLKSEEESQDGTYSDVRDSFVASWRGGLVACLDKWSNRGYFMTVFGLNISIMLLLLSLQFRSTRSSAQSIMKECCSLALQTLRTVDNWHRSQGQAGAESLVHASNFVLVNLAYGGGLLLKLASVFEALRVEEVAELCSRLAIVLREIGACRLTGVSIATQYAEQIEGLPFRQPYAKQREPKLDSSSAEVAAGTTTPSAHLLPPGELFDFSALSNQTLETFTDLGTYSFGNFLDADLFDPNLLFPYDDNTFTVANSAF